MRSVSTRTAELLLLLLTLQLHTGQSQSFLAQERAAALCKPPTPAQECFYFSTKSENAVTVDRKQRRWDQQAVSQRDSQTVLRDVENLRRNPPKVGENAERNVDGNSDRSVFSSASRPSEEYNKKKSSPFTE